MVGDTGECRTGGLASRRSRVIVTRAVNADKEFRQNVRSAHGPDATYIALPMAESPVPLLRAHARNAPWNARGLAAHAAALVDSAGMKPTNASARATPSARAVRFYVANGLLDRPEGAGTAATYGYRHLLQLLAIKIRQREGQTLDAIKKEMREVTGDALERKVAASLAPALTLQMDSSAPKQNGVASWRHVPIADGVELHVRDDSPASRDDLLVALREMLRTTLGRNDFGT